MQQHMVEQFCKAKAKKLWYFREQEWQLWASDYNRLWELFTDVGRMKAEASVFRARMLFFFSSTNVGRAIYASAIALYYIHVK